MEPQQPQFTPQPTPQPAPASPVAPVAAQPVGEDPGKTLGIVSLVTSLLGMGLIGLILGIMAKKKSSAAGYKNTMALAGIIISILSMVIGLIVGVAIFMGAAGATKECQKLGAGTHTLDNGTVITCGSSS